MTDYISREAAIAVIYGQHVGGKEACENARPNTYGADLREIVADIEDIPTADVREVVTCDACVWHVDDGFHYCNKWCAPCPDNAEFFCAYGERPNCGADMREES